MATTEEELLVFGYACKLFGDDEKALQVENGELLVEIDGMKIDRFDGRGILPNLKDEIDKVIHICSETSMPGACSNMC